MDIEFQETFNESQEAMNNQRFFPLIKQAHKFLISSQLIIKWNMLDEIHFDWVVIIWSNNLLQLQTIKKLSKILEELDGGPILDFTVNSFFQMP